jgi:hypothetical protein
LDDKGQDKALEETTSTCLKVAREILKQTTSKEKKLVKFIHTVYIRLGPREDSKIRTGQVDVIEVE